MISSYGILIIQFIITPKSDERLKKLMSEHYSQPKGFVGRSICYAIYHNDVYYGHTVAGSATRHLPNRHEFLETDSARLNNIINNIFFHVIRIDDKYPIRNFVPAIIKQFVIQASTDWKKKYGDDVAGFESLIELPRTGESYRRAGWTKVGKTKGYTCKRIAGKGTDNWTGRRVWDVTNLRPKWVFCYKV